MKVKKNKFKAALKGDKPLYGLWMGIADPGVAEIGASAGFDWLLIDGEHGPFDLRSVMAHLQAIEPHGVPALVRPVEGSVAVIKQLMDIGAQTLLVPMVESAEQAEQIVKAAHYPPRGIRGLGTSMARASMWNRVPDYLTTANDEVCVIVQIETLAGLENIEAIALVDGVDGIFVGPSDLSAAMGHIGNPGHPEVVAAVSGAFEIASRLGKPAGVLAVTRELADQYVAAGARFIGVGCDAALLANATRQLAVSYIDDIDATEGAAY